MEKFICNDPRLNEGSSVVPTVFRLSVIVPLLNESLKIRTNLDERTNDSRFYIRPGTELRNPRVLKVSVPFPSENFSSVGLIETLFSIPTRRGTPRVRHTRKITHAYVPGTPGRERTPDQLIRGPSRVPERVVGRSRYFGDNTT